VAYILLLANRKCRLSTLKAKKKVDFFKPVYIFLHEYKGAHKRPIFQILKPSIDFKEIWHEYQIIQGHPKA
jgi:hypothetical protein